MLDDLDKARETSSDEREETWAKGRRICGVKAAGLGGKKCARRAELIASGVEESGREGNLLTGRPKAMRLAF